MVLKELDLLLKHHDLAVSSSEVDSDTSHRHVEDRGAEGEGKGVGVLGNIVDLRFEGFEDFKRDAAVKTIVHPLPLVICHRLHVGWGDDGGGIDGAH